MAGFSLGSAKLTKNPQKTKGCLPWHN